jgi:hypothetical protein
MYRVMGAWKLRAVVYGMLAVVCALVLWQSGALASEPERPKDLRGLSEQGHAVYVRTHSGEVIAFNVARVDGRCRGGYRWPVLAWRRPLPVSDTYYRRDGRHFRLRTFPLPGWGTFRHRIYMSMDATIEAGGEAVHGTVAYRASPGIPCASGPVPFRATR